METLEQPAIGTSPLRSRVIAKGIALLAVAVVCVVVGVKLASSFGSDESANEQDLLQLVEGGIPSDLPAIVPLRGTFSATFVLERTDHRYVRTLDVFVTDSKTGRAVSGEFVINAVTSMRFMDHDVFESAAVDAGNGHFRIPLDFSMPGEWQIDLTFATPSGPASLALFVELLN